MKIAVSSIAFLGKGIEDIVEIAKRQNYMLEFSSGLPYQPDMEEVYLASELDRLPHNYFPAPETPFVLNLASADNEIREKSIQHCFKGLWLTKESGAPFFAAHAGFCLDPRPSDLGKELSKPSDIDRAKHWNIFLESVRTVLEEADRLAVDFLIENNVVASFNLLENGKNPLLCTDPEETGQLFKEIDHARLGLLLDTAHLKVSANSLGFDPDAAVDYLAPYIRGVHHSDNNGQLDSNDRLDENYWFLKHLHEFRDVLHVLEVKKIDTSEIDRSAKLLEKNAF